MDLSEFRCEADIIVQLSYAIRSLLIEIMMEKIELVLLGDNDFDYIKNSTLIALFGVFALSRV